MNSLSLKARSYFKTLGRVATYGRLLQDRVYERARVHLAADNCTEAVCIRLEIASGPADEYRLEQGPTNLWGLWVSPSFSHRFPAWAAPPYMYGHV